MSGSVGSTTAGVDLHTGAFDNNYWGATPSSGQLFLCGTGPADTTPYHYWIGFTSYPVMNSAPTGSLQRYTTTGLPCAPAAEIYNPNINLGGVAGDHDLLIGGLVGTTTNGWIIANDISSGAVPAGLNTVNYPGGISGVTVDNTSTSAQASSISSIGDRGDLQCLALRGEAYPVELAIAAAGSFSRLDGKNR